MRLFNKNQICGVPYETETVHAVYSVGVLCHRNNFRRSQWILFFFKLHYRFLNDFLLVRQN